MSDFRQAGHLPNLREGGVPADPSGLPRQRRGTTPQMHGRFPDYDVLENAAQWDDATREVVLARVRELPPICFFDDVEAAAVGAFCDCVLAQDAEPRIPVLAMVDSKLHRGERDGFQHAGMPDDGVVWRMVARGLDDVARHEHGATSFAAAPLGVQHSICDSFSRGDLHGGVWEEMPVSEAWSVVMRYALQAFYSHPWSWNEIGFGGPAYPRGYSRLGIGMREEWEGREEFEVDPVTDTRKRGLA